VVLGGHDAEPAREIQLAREFARAYLAALLAGRAGDAEDVIREAIEGGLREAVIDDHVIEPALVEVGDLWAAGRITIADEHLATSISMRVLVLQREAFRVARQRAQQRVLLAGTEGELHVVGLEMAASVLLHAGYDVRFFGADLPVGEVAAAVARHRPAVVGFTTARALTAANLPAAVQAARSVDPAVGVVVGGRGVEDLATAEWDVLVCRHVGDAVGLVDGLVQRARRN
jgi:MerR family transcriptional regulator, light-induced transcriptional regulator